jgi:hypothetical protein
MKPARTNAATCGSGPASQTTPGRRRTASSPWPPTTGYDHHSCRQALAAWGVPPHPVLAYLLVACGCCSSVGWSASPRPAIPPRRDTTGRSAGTSGRDDDDLDGNRKPAEGGIRGDKGGESHGTSLAARGWSPRMQQRQPVVDDRGTVARRRRAPLPTKPSTGEDQPRIWPRRCPWMGTARGSRRPRPPCPPTSTPTWIGNTPTRPRTGCPICSSWAWDLALTYSARRAARRALTSGHSSFTTL